MVKMHGNGKYKYNNRLIYEGGYINGTKNGLGKLIYPIGKIYEGDFVNGFRRGKEFIVNNEISDKSSNKNKIVKRLKIIQM